MRTGELVVRFRDWLFANAQQKSCLATSSWLLAKLPDLNTLVWLKAKG